MGHRHGRALRKGMETLRHALGQTIRPCSPPRRSGSSREAAHTAGLEATAMSSRQRPNIEKIILGQIINVLPALI
jgi:hypothetical protein